VNGVAVDYNGVTINSDSLLQGGFLNFGTAEFKLELYDASNDQLKQTWTALDDSSLGNVPVEVSGNDKGVTALSFRSGPSLSSTIIGEAQEGTGQPVYVRADAPGLEGQTITVQIYEDDGIGDDHVADLNILIGSQGFGVAPWTPNWQSDDGAAPFNSKKT